MRPRKRIAAFALSSVVFCGPMLLGWWHPDSGILLLTGQFTILATWLTLVLGTVAMFGVSARVFRVGILLTGKRPTLPEIARWAGGR